MVRHDASDLYASVTCQPLLQARARVVTLVRAGGDPDTVPRTQSAYVRTSPTSYRLRAL